MDNDNGLSQYLLAGAQDNVLGGNASRLEPLHDLSSKQDDENMVVSQLIHEMNNIKQVSNVLFLITNAPFLQTQNQYGMPEIGDLFKTRPQDVRDTINSVYFMLKQRI